MFSSFKSAMVNRLEAFVLFGFLFLFARALQAYCEPIRQGLVKSMELSVAEKSEEFSDLSSKEKGIFILVLALICILSVAFKFCLCTSSKQVCSLCRRGREENSGSLP
ncbi:unnamed protein product [Calicophoron daubneyi]|uniref:Uncharacterized protein n=1 Tax=Calicophoron daubneyi TaxID=300641 RepID=A0AAV2U0G8_CALDB